MNDWHSVALKMSSNGSNSGEITRELQKCGAFSDEPFSKCYERVRKYVRKHRGSQGQLVQNFIPNEVSEPWSRTIRFGLISDTHIGSKYTQLSHLHAFYAICEAEGVHTVYHAGDISEGDQMRIGHEYEVYVHGADDFVNHIASAYPQIDGITTEFITGNHDASIYKHSGCDIGNHIAQLRPDMKYLGRDCAIVHLTPNCTLELRHPWDGSAYSISQKVQKIIDNMETKPNILAVGHYHKAEQLFYKGVFSFQPGCFQARTPFEIGKNIIPVMGGWIIEVKVDEEGKVLSIGSKFIPFYDTLKEDYKNFI